MTKSGAEMDRLLSHYLDQHEKNGTGPDAPSDLAELVAVATALRSAHFPALTQHDRSAMRSALENCDAARCSKLPTSGGNNPPWLPGAALVVAVSIAARLLGSGAASGGSPAEWPPASTVEVASPDAEGQPDAAPHAVSGPSLPGVPWSPAVRSDINVAAPAQSHSSRAPLSAALEVGAPRFEPLGQLEVAREPGRVLSSQLASPAPVAAALVAAPAAVSARPRSAVGTPTPVGEPAAGLRSLAHPLGADQTSGPLDYRYVASWPLPSGLPDGLFEPFDVALGQHGRLYIADALHRVVRVFDSTGAALGQWEDRPIDLRACSDAVFVPMVVAARPDMNRVYVLWQAWSFQGEDTGESLRNWVLQERRSDGLVLRTMRPGGRSPGDIVIADNGDLILADAYGFDRLQMPEGYPAGGLAHNRPYFKSQSGTAALLPDDRIALVTAAGAVEIYPLAGSRDPIGGFSAQALANRRPVAVASDAAGRLHVLLRTDGFGLDQPVVYTFAPDGRRERTLTEQELGVPAAPMGHWPFSLDAGHEDLALVTATGNFEVLRIGANSSLRFTGAPARDCERNSANGACQPTVAGTADTCTAGLSLAEVADGGVVVLDHSRGRIVRYSPAGALTQSGQAPPAGRKVAANATGDIFVADDVGVVSRLSMGGGPAVWESTCDCGAAAPLALWNGGLAVGRPHERAVRLLGADTGASSDEWQVAAPGAWPADLAADAKSLYTLDTWLGEVRLWASPGVASAAWRVAPGVEPVAVSAGQVDGARIVAILGRDGAVLIRDADTGAARGEWHPHVPETPNVVAADIAMGHEGRVYVADVARRSIHVFEPTNETLPTATATPTFRPRPTGRSWTTTPAPTATFLPTPTQWLPVCSPTGDKQAGPARVPLGETAAVTLTFSLTCPPPYEYEGLDVMLVLDRSGSMGQERKLSAAVTAAAVLADFVLADDRHRMGIVSFNTAAQLDVPLTNERDELILAFQLLRANGGTTIGLPLEMAKRHLYDERRPTSLPVIVLVSDGCGGDFDRALSAAQDARRLGYRVYTIGIGTTGYCGEALRLLATTPDYYYHAPDAAALGAIFDLIRQDMTLAPSPIVYIDDVMSDVVAYVSSSAVPAAAQEDRTWVRWSYAPNLGQTYTLFYRILPLVAGRIPTNREAFARYADADGVIRQFDFPVPEIEVIAPTAQPTVTGTPTTRASPAPRPLYLPLAVREVCEPERRRIAAALVVDASSSMAEPTIAGRSKLDAARAAALAFLDRVNLEAGDTAAIVAFNADARLLQGLTTDRRLLEAALGRITLERETRLDRGIEVAHEALEPALGSELPVLSVMIVLTDGKANPTPPEAAVESARQAKGDGIVLFTVGLGEDIDAHILAAIATSPVHFHRAGDGEELSRVYEAIAGAIPCPPTAFWGKR